MTEPNSPSGIGYSLPVAIPLLIDPLLLVSMFLSRGHWWLYLIHLVYFALLGTFLWVALSKSQWEEMHSKAPNLSRANWILNWLFLFFIVPALLWLFFGLRTLTGAPITLQR